MKNNKITLPTGSWNLLKSAIGSIGWTNTCKDIYVVGKMEDENPIPLAPINPAWQEPEVSAWAKVPVEYEVSESQRTVFKKALEFVVGKAEMPANTFSAKLLNEFVGEQ